MVKDIVDVLIPKVWRSRTDLYITKNKDDMTVRNQGGAKIISPLIVEGTTREDKEFLLWWW